MGEIFLRRHEKILRNFVLELQKVKFVEDVLRGFMGFGGHFDWLVLCFDGLIGLIGLLAL